MCSKFSLVIEIFSFDFLNSRRVFKNGDTTQDQWINSLAIKKGDAKPICLDEKKLVQFAKVYWE